jgi:RNA polymerase sigma factor (sigma-70 family)
MTRASQLIGGLPDMTTSRSRDRARDLAVASAPAETTLDLVRRARQGDQAATDELFARYEQRLRRWAHGRLPVQARGALDTHDLSQDVLFKVFRHLPSFEPRHAGAFREYVWTTLWNQVRDLARLHRRRPATESLEMFDMPANSPSPLEHAIGREAFARYEAGMERLRAEDREAIIMRLELGLSHAEVAQALGKASSAAAHMTVSRALVRLAQEMADGRRSDR